MAVDAGQIRHGVTRAVISAPVWVDGEAPGDLDVIRPKANPWTSVDAVETLAGLATALLQSSTSGRRPDENRERSTAR